LQRLDSAYPTLGRIDFAGFVNLLKRLHTVVNLIAYTIAWFLAGLIPAKVAEPQAI
jgi:hypothetical protein